MMFKLLFATTLFLGTVFSAVAQGETVGVGYYFIRSENWNCAPSISALSSVRMANASILWETPGAQNACLNKMIALPNFHRLTIHVFNQVCVRNKRCGPYETFAGLTSGELDKKLRQKDPALFAKMKIRLQEVHNYVQNFPVRVRCLVNPILEHDQSAEALRNMNEFTRQVIGGRCEIVTNPVGMNSNKSRAGGDFLELHGSKPKLTAPCTANLDGETIDFHAHNAWSSPALPEDEVQNYIRRYNHCDGVDLWVSEFNCLVPGPFVDPRKRKNCANKKVIDLIIKHVKEAQAPPLMVPQWGPADAKSLKNCVKVFNKPDGVGGFLWKQSDVHPGAVALFPGQYKSNFKKVKTVKKGKVLEQLSYGGRGNADAKGERQTWRSKIPAKKYPYNIVVNADNLCWVVKNPKVRYD